MTTSNSDAGLLEIISGEGGSLSKGAWAADKFNNALTDKFDAFFGSADNTDTFDASCNTCKHFQRRQMTALEKSERNIGGMPGICSLKSIATTGWHRGQYCGFENAECYENRRTGLRPHQVMIDTPAAD
jgi:hypothetical protein